jgi:hypothetical protein
MGQTEYTTRIGVQISMQPAERAAADELVKLLKEHDRYTEGFYIDGWSTHSRYSLDRSGVINELVERELKRVKQCIEEGTAKAAAERRARAATVKRVAAKAESALKAPSASRPEAYAGKVTMHRRSKGKKPS